MGHRGCEWMKYLFLVTLPDLLLLPSEMPRFRRSQLLLVPFVEYLMFLIIVQFLIRASTNLKWYEVLIQLFSSLNHYIIQFLFYQHINFEYFRLFANALPLTIIHNFITIPIDEKLKKLIILRVM